MAQRTESQRAAPSSTKRKSGKRIQRFNDSVLSYIDQIDDLFNTVNRELLNINTDLISASETSVVSYDKESERKKEEITDERPLTQEEVSPEAPQPQSKEPAWFYPNFREISGGKYPNLPTPSEIANYVYPPNIRRKFTKEKGWFVQKYVDGKWSDVSETSLHSLLFDTASVDVNNPPASPSPTMQKKTQNVYRQGLQRPLTQEEVSPEAPQPQSQEPAWFLPNIREMSGGKYPNFPTPSDIANNVYPPNTRPKFTKEKGWFVEMNVSDEAPQPQSQDDPSSFYPNFREISGGKYPNLPNPSDIANNVYHPTTRRKFTKEKGWFLQKYVDGKWSDVSEMSFSDTASVDVNNPPASPSPTMQKKTQNVYRQGLQNERNVQDINPKLETCCHDIKETLEDMDTCLNNIVSKLS